MSHLRYLIDTNVFIGLEDDREIDPNFSHLLQLASKHSVRIFVHEAARDDIARDKDTSRRRISLSKFAKFAPLSKVRGLTTSELSRKFGYLRKANDVVDATLLHALSLDLADFLVTEDRKLHERARKHAPELSDRLLFVADATSLLESIYEPIDVPIRYIEEIEAHAVPLDDPIFESLRDDYDKFDEWWKKCVSELRKCWIVARPGSQGIAGILVRKDEASRYSDATLSGTKILKICTFKVAPENRGIKLGELLLKQVLWFAQTNGYDLVYLTTYPKQNALIELLDYYGFQQTLERDDGELLYEKTFSRERLILPEGESVFSAQRTNYPRFSTESFIHGYGVPILEAYHDELFPELRDLRQADMFEHVGLYGGPSRPGNTIRKVYLSRSSANLKEPGSLLFFYKGKSKSTPSQAITSVGIFENMELAHSTKELMQLAQRRSVYSEAQLDKLGATYDRPVKVINFLLAGYFREPVDLKELREIGAIKHHPSQSIFQINRCALEALFRKLDLGFRVI
ncbi:GNAT family N-acetyltransferase [Thioclava sp. F34-6]|uniref:GNAT family N-acetyltransferase n=1 Tax=Thioclava sp. F34-6 TaxID=1973003 RepID=UPI000B540059|nr:GNAT family N-acetyltransferase [Thioclava sp. F34-6]OWY15565.1 GNAT family N-acetyltransferase [Thioclava sp. F34-6]